MTKQCQTFIISLRIVNRFEKTHSTNLEHCFTASITAQSTTILSELKMFSFGPYTQARRRDLHQLRYQLHFVEGRAKCPIVLQLCELVIGTRVAG